MREFLYYVYGSVVSISITTFICWVGFKIHEKVSRGTTEGDESHYLERGD